MISWILKIFTLAVAIVFVVFGAYNFDVGSYSFGGDRPTQSETGPLKKIGGDRPTQSGNESLKKMRSIAETQHELAMLLMGKKEFSKAAEEASKIFDLEWPVEEEPVLLKELIRFSDQFRHEDQATLGIQLLENNFKAFKTTPSRATIWKEKGYLYKNLNQMDKALECFREAQRLEKP